MTKRNATVFIIIGGGRSDYIKRQNMPFLDGLARTGITAGLKATPGADARSVLLQGHSEGLLQRHVFDPDKSPYHWMNERGPLRLFNRPRRANAATRATIRRLTRLVVEEEADPGYIPPVQLPYFRPSAATPSDAEGIFGSCVENERPHLRIQEPHDDATEDRLVREIRSGEPRDLIVASFDALADAGRREGPLPDEAPQLRALDERLARVHAALAGSHRSWNLFICGDHGMAPVRHRINALEVLATADAEPGRDYVAYVDRTYLTVWHLTPRGAREIDRVLHRIPGSHVLSDEDRRRLRLERGPRTGDRIVATKPGVAFWPNFVDPPSTRSRGVHGAFDPRDEGESMAVLVGSERHARPVLAGSRRLEDVYPTLCELVGLPVPRDRQRRSLLQVERRALVVGG